MRFVDDRLLIAPTDLATFTTCRHRTGLELGGARGALHRPAYEDPYAAILRRKGEEHEQRYVESLRTRGLRVVTIPRGEGPPTAHILARQSADTLAAMGAGADVIVQARLVAPLHPAVPVASSAAHLSVSSASSVAHLSVSSTAHSSVSMAGYADVLIRVDTPSSLWPWSYEAQDTKLARETKGGAVLQLCGYSELLAAMQGVAPAHFHVVTPDAPPVQTFRVADYAAYYRAVRASFEQALAMGDQHLREAHYPEPVEHCAVCAWEAHCLRQRRADDHLSFIAGATRLHRQELIAQGHATLTAAAQMLVPVTFKPSRGAPKVYDRLGDQARVQHRQRREGQPVFERLPIGPGEGLSRLPEPSPGDVFLDLEGARFARDQGREFLFGLLSRDGYQSWWAINDEEEKRAFQAVIHAIEGAWDADPTMHVYHFNHYEPTAFKKLVGRHVTQVEALNRLLRAERFVDLYPIVRQAVRCGVESYSIKRLEPYYGFARRVPLTNAAQPLLAVELALEARMPEAITGDIRDAVDGYNEDDCRSTRALRDWLERLRTEAVASGADVPRPAPEDRDPSPNVSALQEEVERLRARLLDGLPPEAARAAHPDHPRWLLAYLIDWHRREDNAQWWEYFRLKELSEEDLLDESGAVAGLYFAGRLQEITHRRTGKPTGSVIDRYGFPNQDVELRRGGRLQLQDGRGFGEVECLDREARTIDIRKGPSVVSVHPTAVFASDVVPGTVQQQSVMRLAERFLAGNPADCGVELLRRASPRLGLGHAGRLEHESEMDTAVRLATLLDRTTLAIQGPPGAGKTYVGAQMIRALVKAGRKVGVTANSHKVIRNLLDAVAEQAARAGERVQLAAKVNEPSETTGHLREIADNEEALAALASDVDVLGGTAWLWSRPEAMRTADVLFVDEAGQMSLANALAVSQAADSMVLLGDPRQLEQPQQASHPDGVGISALEHVLNGAETMPEGQGIFLPTTYRMSPALTRFTSELFYAGKLQSAPRLESQALSGTGRFDGSGLWLVPVLHDGNQNASTEEVDAVEALVTSLLDPEWTLTPPSARDGTRSAGPSGPCWIDADGVRHVLTGADIRVVAPFNAQVNRLSERLSPLGVPVGTVDKFQGQTAAVVIYSMTTSRPEDAPRGMEFLYSLNRLNVATSRARCAAFVVCSPRLLAPDCRTPRQMHLANALCRLREFAR